MKDDLVEALRALVRERDEYINDNDGHNPWADPGCIECTAGVTPDRYNTGPCAYHRACAALIAAGEKL